MACVVWICCVIGGNSFFASLGSSGVNAPNYKKNIYKFLHERKIIYKFVISITNLIILISIQLFVEVFNILNNCGASDK